GGEPVGAAGEVAVEQGVADDQQGGLDAGVAHDVLRPPVVSSRHRPLSSAASKAAHTMWTATRWSSWTVAARGASTHRDSSLPAISGLGAGPVRAHTLRPAARAASAADSRLALAPLVDSSISTSPGRPCARTWRAKAASTPQSLAMAVVLEVSACRAIAENAGRSSR